MNATPSPLCLLALLLILPWQMEAADFLNHPRWDQGTAEWTTYAAKELRYGILRDATATLILVKEPWNNERHVKSDGKGDRTVLKLNQILSVPTGMYRYEQMHSLFVDRATGAPVKFSYSHHDACGNTFKMGLFHDQLLTLTSHTYWDGEGDGTRTLPWKPRDTLYESLPLLTRCWAAQKPAMPLDLNLLNPQMLSRAGTPATTAARATASTAEGLIHFTIKHPGGTDTLIVDETFPHTLRAWKRADGSSLTLQKTQMIDYWNRNRPEDQAQAPTRLK
jgi:hypothetical protein